MGRPADALAANDVAGYLGITRSDPLFASLGPARQMAIHGVSQDRSSLRRAFDQAQDAMERAEPGAYGPVRLTAFYDEAELHSLALSAYLALGDHSTAEYHAHQGPATLRPYMLRSRAIATSRLTHTQLARGEADTATATAMKVPTDAAPHHARVSSSPRSAWT
ncbi:hypothetical protein J2Z21_008589 [Streptomyces griseochromogenes]|uniref:Uncharacterized protein n=1 Tax=Streptomyces griseochromogenes TaxID=68214 RepID=A0A1B1B3I6_9ACTN|nr:hypothetical protein [Streptomyces griseochromogenes]ANP53321.1 hypothetical protein AVL59_30690 [Streptomyces griseochromogenes]MBP2055573.1 hypothetical protein [Streptomyces griseochromogenes]